MLPLNPFIIENLDTLKCFGMQSQKGNGGGMWIPKQCNQYCILLKAKRTICTHNLTSCTEKLDKQARAKIVQCLLCLRLCNCT